MELYIYSDESGVFDKQHNNYYVYGGLIFIDKKSRDIYSRKYIASERNISFKYTKGFELKACRIKNRDKNKLYKVTKNCIKFGAIIQQQDILSEIFIEKKSKQRYLDYVYKLTLKNAFLEMRKNNIITFDEITKLNIFVDEHTTATNGRYELRESLLQEFKYGTYNFNYSAYYPPIFNNLNTVELQHCNSAKKPLIRAADIVANRIYYLATNGLNLESDPMLYIKRFPK